MYERYEVRIDAGDAEADTYERGTLVAVYPREWSAAKCARKIRDVLDKRPYEDEIVFVRSVDVWYVGEVTDPRNDGGALGTVVKYCSTSFPTAKTEF